MSEIDILRQFKNCLINFFDELIEQLPQEGDLIIVRIFLKDRISINEVMNYFIHKLLPLKQLVSDRNEKFFLENDVLFEKLQSTKVNHFRRIWMSDVFDDDNKEVIFKWFETFIRLAEVYQKIKLSKSS